MRTQRTGERRIHGSGLGRRRGLVEREVTVSLPGGDLTIAWRSDNRIVMTGPANEAYRGSFEWDDFA